MRDKPLCAKCGNRHWGFARCEDNAPLKITRNIPVGFRPWGDRMHTYQVEGPNVFGLPKKFKPRGTVTPPPEKEAA